MLQLTTLEHFETLWNGYDATGNPGPIRFLVWFSAPWCGPCKKIVVADIEEAARDANIPFFYYCDAELNPATVERAGVRSFPVFILYSRKQEIGRRAHFDTTKICQWIRKMGTENPA